MARTVAYLAQTVLQSIQIAQKEYIYGFGTPEWGAKIRNNVNGNLDHLNETDPDTGTPASDQQPTANPNSNHAAPTDLESCSGRSSGRCSCGVDSHEDS